MARPRKRRRVCRLPNHLEFGPLGGNLKTDSKIILSVEEFEVIRLIDLEGLEQVEAAERMEVARSTVQRMYSEAKGKLANALVNGRILKIKGGDYTLCDLDQGKCSPCNRGRHGHGNGQGLGQGQGRGKGRNR